MKRELKQDQTERSKGSVVGDCRAYPDEKGIETASSGLMACNALQHCRAYPDEKGIETSNQGRKCAHRV